MSDGTKGPVPVLGIKSDVFGEFSDWKLNVHSCLFKHPRTLLIWCWRVRCKDKPPSRIELRDMRANYKDQWNLYLQAMERFMDPTKEKDPLSYYQIAGQSSIANCISLYWAYLLRYSRDAFQQMAKLLLEQGETYRLSTGILHLQLGAVPHLASSISCSLRGMLPIRVRLTIPCSLANSRQNL